jgi:hypothetical protein
MYKFMDEKERERCKDWINKYLSEYQRKQADSYTLKHMFQHMTGIYASDQEFQEIMRECGYESFGKRDSLFSVRIDSVVIQNLYYSK